MSPGIAEELIRNRAVRDGSRVLEIGTGYAHWEALFLRNKVDIRATLYDVWDNRSFKRFQSYVRQLTDPDVRKRLNLDSDGALALMRQAAGAKDFEEAYNILGFSYVLDQEGKLNALNEYDYDLIISRDVGEHLRKEDIPDIISNSYARLRPSGWAFHQIALEDHIRVYVKRTHPKEYLRFDREVHRKWISGNIQYTNLVQIPEWMELFEATGFNCVYVKKVQSCNLQNIPIHPSWSSFQENDLACTVVQFYLQKPATSV